jgi:hypothetical protein
MGLLDEAIREHLDLKRRRGADPTEVERAEREALGPVRRAPGPAPAEAGVPDLSAEGGFAYDQEDEAWDDASLQDAPAAAAGRPARHDSADLGPDLGEAAPHHYEPEPAPRRSRLSRIFGRPEAEPDLVEEDDFDPPPPAEPTAPPEPRGRSSRTDEEPEPQPVTPTPHPAGGGQIGDHTVEYDVDEVLESEKDEDVLEETPEFLQDTPDHDRLWFEQRPPRDFDFDG